MDQDTLSKIFSAIQEIEKIAANAGLDVGIGEWDATQRGHGQELVHILTRTTTHDVWERDAPDGEWSKL